MQAAVTETRARVSKAIYSNAKRHKPCRRDAHAFPRARVATTDNDLSDRSLQVLATTIGAHYISLCPSVGMPFSQTTITALRHHPVMPPRKKQRTDGNEPPVASVPRRTTRASAKAAQADGPVAEGSANGAKPTPKAKAKMANPDAPKRVVNKGRLQTLPDLAVEVQLEASPTQLRRGPH